MSLKNEVAVSYDVSNEFLRLWLDRRMNYTCAVYDEGPYAPTTDLDAAQMNKLAILHEMAHIEPDMRVLDIGCGWGACIEYLAHDRGVREVHGITLSEAQVQEITARHIPRTHVSCCNYVDYRPDVLFDAVTCICMTEHIVRPEQARAGRQIAAYRDFFKRVHQWTRPGAWFALQAIVRNVVPRNRQDLEDIGWVTYAIFPGGITGRIADYVEAVTPSWEIMELKTRRTDYQRTTAAWLEGLRANESTVRDRWGDQVFEDYDRYLRTCVRAFDKHYQSLAQFSLRRID